MIIKKICIFFASLYTFPILCPPTKDTLHPAKKILLPHASRTVWINNEGEGPCTITYKRPDAGFQGSHVLVEERTTLNQGEKKLIRTVRNKNFASQLIATLANQKVVNVLANEQAQEIVFFDDCITINYSDDTLSLLVPVPVDQP